MKSATMLQKANIKPTAIRQNIVKILKKDHALSADQITLKLNSIKHLKADRVTVYRNLKTLQKKQVVCELHSGFGPTLFELSNHHHQHAVCLECKSLHQIDTDSKPNHQNTKDFHITHTHITYYGYCNKCHNNKEAL